CISTDPNCDQTTGANCTGACGNLNPTAPPPPCADVDPTTKQCNSVSTSFGNWSTDPRGFVATLFSILLSISGSIAVLIIIFAGYGMMTSQGDPEKVQGAKEQMTAAL